MRHVRVRFGKETEVVEGGNASNHYRDTFSEGTDRTAAPPHPRLIAITTLKTKAPRPLFWQKVKKATFFSFERTLDDIAKAPEKRRALLLLPLIQCGSAFVHLSKEPPPRKRDFIDAIAIGIFPLFIIFFLPALNSNFLSNSQSKKQQ